MARRIFLHVGCPKTGTSFLQGVVWSNRAVLRRQGLLVPASMRHHYRGTLFIRQVWSGRSAGAAIAADWEHLVSLVRRSKKDVLITHELLGPASEEQASFAVEALGGLDTHVVITARDMARQLPASWQQSIKHGGTRHLEDFVRDVIERGPEPVGFGEHRTWSTWRAGGEDRYPPATFIWSRFHREPQTRPYCGRGLPP